MQIKDVIPVNMARLNILVSLLATWLYTVADGQSWFCTPNLPSNNGQKPGDSVDGQFVKSSVIALQTHMQQLVSDNAKLQTQMQDLSNENSELRQKVATISKSKNNSCGLVTIYNCKTT